MSFDLKKFDKSINLNKRDNLKIESKWKLVKLGEVCEDIISGSTSSKHIREYWNSKDINWATIKDFTSLYIENTMQHISRKGLDKVRIVPVNSVLLSCTGTIGKVAINKIALTANQQINSIVCKNILKPEYLGYFFENKTNSLSVLTDNIGVKHVNTHMLRDFLVPLPPY